MFYQIIGKLVSLIHLGVAASVIAFPFLSLDLCRFHAVFTPFMMLHWFLNNDACFLTFLEAWCLGVPVKTTFFSRVFSPLYLVQDKTVWAITGGLLLVSWIRLKINS